MQPSIGNFRKGGGGGKRTSSNSSTNSNAPANQPTGSCYQLKLGSEQELPHTRWQEITANVWAVRCTASVNTWKHAVRSRTQNKLETVLQKKRKKETRKHGFSWQVYLRSMTFVLRTEKIKSLPLTTNWVSAPPKGTFERILGVQSLPPPFFKYLHTDGKTNWS